MKPTKTYGLTHLAIYVKDLDRTRRFYQSIFDMELMYQEEDFLQLTTPGAHDILVFEKKNGASGHTGGIAHFGFRLRKPDDMAEMTEKVKKAGGKIFDSGEFEPGAPYIFFNDPDGYEVEVWYEK